MLINHSCEGTGGKRRPLGEHEKDADNDINLW